MMNITTNLKTGEAMLLPPGSTAPATPPGRKIWEIRTEEQHYAMLRDQTIQETNRYGQKIDLIAHTEGKLPVGRSLFINENQQIQ